MIPIPESFNEGIFYFLKYSVLELGPCVYPNINVCWDIYDTDANN